MHMIINVILGACGSGRRQITPEVIFNVVCFTVGGHMFPLLNSLNITHSLALITKNVELYVSAQK